MGHQGVGVMSIIVQPPLELFLERAIPCLRAMETRTVPCHRCGEPISFPLTARQEDIDAFQKLLEIAAEFLDENGVQEMILERLWSKIKERMNLQ